MAPKVGHRCKVFYKEGGVGGGGDWTEATTVSGDPTLSHEYGQAEVKTRGTRYIERLTALIDAGIEIRMPWDLSDPHLEAFHDAHLNDVVIGIEVLDGPRASGSGLRFDAKVFRLNRDEPIEGVVEADIALYPAYSSTKPEWIEEGSATGSGSY